MGSVTKNDHAHGGGPRRPSEASDGVSTACEANGTPGAIGAHGAKMVIGGKLTFLPGAVVEGAEGLFDSPAGEGQPLSYMAPSEATTIAVLREDFNALLAALQEAGLMASAPAK